MDWLVFLVILGILNGGMRLLVSLCPPPSLQGDPRKDGAPNGGDLKDGAPEGAWGFSWWLPLRCEDAPSHMLRPWPAKPWNESQCAVNSGLFVICLWVV